MKVADAWEALFSLWHERDHDLNVPWIDLLRRLEDLERRIVKLEAFMAARKTVYTAAKLLGVPFDLMED